MHRPLQKTHYEGADLLKQAAALLYGLVKNHGFRDGNKRVAVTATGAFLYENGHGFSCPKGAIADFVEGCSTPEWTEEAVEEWVRSNVGAREASRKA